ncbi:hypothetical protein [Mycobacterium marinum]|uniref:hypothetical protein n=1 Tax=Mycobacterium marinum TaxID=1781 RepID=UPI002358B978|nr:hypothetical protein [Mycobacterium marinum]MDC8981243.1 hypothetical protein [Mycobacterium marinum]
MSVRRQLAAKKAALSRSRKPDDPEYIAVSRELEYEGLREHAARVVADWAPLSNDDRRAIAALLLAGGAA